MKSHYDLIFVSTHINNNYIYKLIDSIISNNSIVNICIVIVSQDTTFIWSNTSDLIDLFVINEPRVSLSRARNIALKFLLTNKASASYIMFPDDDSSFDYSFFKAFKEILESNKCFLTSIYKEGTKEYYLGKSFKEDTVVSIDDHHLIGSPNQVLLYNLLKNNIWFNESLGIGAQYGSCEDYDLFLKINLENNHYYYNSMLYSFHPAKSVSTNNVKLKKVIERYKNYSLGFVYIIYAYRKQKFIPIFLFKCLGASLISLFTLKFKMAIMYFCLFFIRINALISLKKSINV